MPSSVSHRLSPRLFFGLYRKRFKNLLLFLLIVPFWTNFLLHVYAWFFVLEREGFFNTLAARLGIIQQPYHLLNTPSLRS